MRYKISELAKLLNISTNTVRRYEEKGYIEAVRGETSGYRYYDDDGVFGIINAKLLRKYGFTHEELHLMKDFNIEQMLEAYKQRMKEMDEQIAYMTYVRHRIKDDCLLMEKAAVESEVYEKECVEQVYVLYKEGEKLLQEPERLKKIQEFLYSSPEVQHIYIVPKEQLDKGKFTICCGWAVKDMHMEKYHLTESEYTLRYKQQSSVMGIVKIPAALEEFAGYSQEKMKQLLIGKHLDYMKEHNLELAGDILSIVITKVCENEKDIIYLLVSVPVKIA